MHIGDTGYTTRMGIFLSVLFVSLILPNAIVAQNSSSDIKTIHVKFKEEFRPKNPISGRTTGNGRMDQVSEKYRAMIVKRLFQHAGVYETAHQVYGLHLWYEIKFHGDINLQSAIRDYKHLDFFEYVEECKEYTNNAAKRFGLDLDPTDGLFSVQWHLRNTGQTGGVVGADINIINAWKIETGSPNVIVAVIDGGINLKHPDIIGSLWTNSDEIPDNGIDDDHNGYVDDIHGYGFGDGSSKIAPDYHGTHVAGIIGASTNNSMGISGIAGGSGFNDGVRLMSCATFGDFNIGGFEDAMVYAADNGAVISQNSWGGGSRAIEAAIDYFVDRAGFDNTAQNFYNNIQTGPMGGGLVIFAAGNSNVDDPEDGYPASYYKNIAVASTDHNDQKSFFSNFGTWVDISAPGTHIWSTVGLGLYENFSGTSMACPMVSGVAALVISNLQRHGLSPTEVWDRMRLSARPVHITNSSHLGRMGAGRVDAFGSLSTPDFISPGAITDLHAKYRDQSSVELEWTATGDNGAIGQAARYEIRYSTSPISSATYDGADIISNPPIPPSSGAKVNLVVEGLQPGTRYYFAVKSRDLFNNISEISNVISVVTLTPPIPQLTTLSLGSHLYTGGIDQRNILVKNIGESDLRVKLGIPNIEHAPVDYPTGAQNRLFAINPARNSIEEINDITGALIRSIPLPVTSTRQYEGLAFDGINLFYGKSNKIYVLNPTTGEVRKTISISGSSYVYGLAWSGRYLYASVYTNTNKVLEIDIDNGNVVRTLPQNGSELTFGGRRGTFFMVRSSDIVEVNPTTGNQVNAITLDGNLSGLAYSGLNNHLYVSKGNAILVIDANSGSTLRSISYTNSTGLASIEYQPQWLQGTDQEYTIPFGITASIPVSFVATGLAGGSYTGNVNVIPLNVNSGNLPVSLSLNINSATDIETVAQIDFGQQYVGLPIDSLIHVENRGFSDLVINTISVNDGRVTVSSSAATLSPGQKLPLYVTVANDEEGVIDATMTIASNDPDEALLTIPIKTTISFPPSIEVSPSSISESILVGESKSITLTITNGGGSPLEWESSISNLGFPQFNQNSITQSGYRKEADSVATFATGDFVHLAPSPENVTCLSQDPQTGQLYAKATIGNNFYRYDPLSNNWTYIGFAPAGLIGQAVHMDGKLYHVGTQLSVYTIQSNTWTSIPFPLEETASSVTSDGKNIYTAFSSDLYKYDPATDEWTFLISIPRVVGGLSHHGGVVYIHHDTNRSVTGDGNTNFFKYYIANGTLIWSTSILGKAVGGSTIEPAARQYVVLGSPRSQPGVAIQMSILNLRDAIWERIALPFQVGAVGGQVFVGKTGVSGIYIVQGSNGTGFIRYETPPFEEWVATTPSYGTLEPGESQTITLNLNASGQDGGVYSGNLRVFSNRPSIEENIPVEVTVIGVPEISLSKTSENIESQIGVGRLASLTIKNTGTDFLHISSISIDHPDYSLFEFDATELIIPSGESVVLRPEFNPTTLGNSVGTFTFYNNDPDEGSVTFTINGNGVIPPSFEFTAEPLTATLFSGSSTTRKITMTNPGGLYIQPTIEVVFPNDWLRNKDSGVFLFGGETIAHRLLFDASGKASGVYEGLVRVWSYVPVSGTPVLEGELPASMEVISAPNLLLNKTLINYGSRYIYQGVDSIIKITNNGDLPLSISEITVDNPFFSIGVSAPLEIMPGQNISTIVRFNPTAAGEQMGQLTFVSNDPEDGSISVNLIGEGINFPSVTTDTNEMIVNGFTDESVTKTFTIDNSGGSNLKWSIITESSPAPQSQSGTQQPSQQIAGGFTALAPTPVQLAAVVLDPGSQRIYARSQYALFKYTHSTGTWVTEYEATYLPHSIEFGSGTFLNNRLYQLIGGNSTTIDVYDLILKDWTSMPNQLGSDRGYITSDGNLLYLAGGGSFKSLNPKTKTWVDLPPPTISLNTVNGMSYANGFIYLHEGSGNGFSRYNIADGRWETLISLPGNTVYGSTIDPIRNRYYAYGKDGGSLLYEYDIASSLWSVHYITSFDISDGGLVFQPHAGYEGIYFLQGKIGTGFAKYEPTAGHNWLRVSPLTGDLAETENQTVGVNLNSLSLSAGYYQGNIQVSSNDPYNGAIHIPVTLILKNFHPTISVTPQVSGSVDRFTLFNGSIRIENDGKNDLQWHVDSELPTWLSVDRSEGVITGFSSDEVYFTVDPTFYRDNLRIDYQLVFNSNDPSSPEVSTTIDVQLTNSPPIILKSIADQILTGTPFQTTVLDLFSDPENDPLVYYANSTRSSIASATVSDGVLTVTPMATGATFINVYASDVFNSSNYTAFNVMVNFPFPEEDDDNEGDVVTGIESIDGEPGFIVSPNPFTSKIHIRFPVQVAGEGYFKIINSIGEIVWESRGYYEHTGFNEILVDGSKFSSGIYHCLLQRNGEIVQTVRLMKN